MKLFIVILSMFIAISCYAAPNLYHYTDKVTGDERGISYGESPLQNPKWNSEIISESQKQHFIDLQKQQMKTADDAKEAEKDRKKVKAKNKLKSLGLDKDEIQAILGDKYGD